MKLSRKCKRDDAADTVIGFILITLVALVAITLVLIGGEPALERVQSGQEADSMLRYFGDLETEVSGLITSSPAGATPVWRVAMPRGDLELRGAHVWAYAVDLEVAGNTYRFDYAGFGDGDDRMSIQNPATGSTSLAAGARIDFYQHQGAVETALGTHSFAGGFPTGSVEAVTLPIALEDNVLELRLFRDATDTTPVARVWFIDTGAMVWHLPVGGTNQRVAYENSGVISEQGNAAFVYNEPKLRQPKARSATIDDVFFRAINLDGTVSAAGRSATDVLLVSGGTHSRFSSSDVDRVQIYPALHWQTPWTQLLDEDTLGYTYTIATHAFASDGQQVATYEAGAKTLATSFVETDIILEVVART